MTREEVGTQSKLFEVEELEDEDSDDDEEAEDPEGLPVITEAGALPDRVEEALPTEDPDPPPTTAPEEIKEES